MSQSNASRPKRRGRPPRDPLTAEARVKLIRAGLIYFTERGYSAVGIDEVLKTSGVPKGSFYHYFKNKADFGCQLIEAYDAYFLTKLDAAFLNSALSPLEQLKTFIEDAIAGMARHEFRRGCLVGNLGQEMAALPEEYRAQLTQVLEGWQDRTADCLRRSIDAGEISNCLQPDDLAAFFWIGWEGAVLRAKLERRAEPLRVFSNTFLSHLKT